MRKNKRGIHTHPRIPPTPCAQYHNPCTSLLGGPVPQLRGGLPSYWVSSRALDPGSVFRIKSGCFAWHLRSCEARLQPTPLALAPPRRGPRLGSNQATCHSLKALCTAGLQSWLLCLLVPFPHGISTLLSFLSFRCLVFQDCDLPLLTAHPYAVTNYMHSCMHSGQA